MPITTTQTASALLGMSLKRRRPMAMKKKKKKGGKRGTKK